MSYDTEDIKTLKFPENVQRRTGMYLGDQSKSLGLPGQCNVAIREITDNSVTEAVKGYGDHVKIVFNIDGSISVEDNGRGIPTGIDKDTGATGIEKCLAELHSGGNFDNNEKSGPGLNGVGGACVNAVSSIFNVDVFRNGWKYTEQFRNGYVYKQMEKHHLSEDDYSHELHPDTDIKKVTGTCITFTLNPDFFSDVDTIVQDDIIDRMRYTVYVVPGLHIDIYDNSRSSEDDGGEYHFKDDGGIEGMLNYVSTGTPIVSSADSSYTKNGIFKISTTAKYKDKVTTVVNGQSVVKERVNTIPVEAAFRYSDSDATNILSFANTIHTFDGGVHQSALENAIVEVFGKMVKKES